MTLKLEPKGLVMSRYPTRATPPGPDTDQGLGWGRVLNVKLEAGLLRVTSGCQEWVGQPTRASWGNWDPVAVSPWPSQNTGVKGPN